MIIDPKQNIEDKLHFKVLIRLVYPELYLLSFKRTSHFILTNNFKVINYSESALDLLCLIGETKVYIDFSNMLDLLPWLRLDKIGILYVLIYR